MKYRTFRALVIGALALAAGGGYMAWSSYAERQEAEEQRILAELQKQQAEEAERARLEAATAPAIQPADAGAAGSAPVALASTEVAVRGGEGASSGGPGGLRPFDASILKLVSVPASGDKVKDALKGNPVKVNLYHDDGSGYYNRLKIDLDRDEKWDEKWTLERGRVMKRQVAPADDEKYSQEFRLEGERWVPGS